MVKSYIYLLYFVGTPYYYIGSTSQLPRLRFLKHINELKNGRHHNIRVTRVWEKYGTPSFIVLEEVSNEEKFNLEQLYLDLFKEDNNCLNLNYKANSAYNGQNKQEPRLVKPIKNVVTGEVIKNFSGSIAELARHITVDQFHLAEVLRGKLRSTSNWVLLDSNVIPVSVKYIGNKLQKDGKIITINGSLNKLSKQLGLSHTYLGDLLRGKVQIAKGWTLVK